MKIGVLGGAAGVLLAAAAFAQPAATDLGNVAVPASITGNGDVAAMSALWFRLTLPTAINSATNWLEFDTAGTAFDTEIGLFSANGTRIADDDDDGPGLQSALSFGSGSGVPTGGAGATNGDGRDGLTLPAGVYYVGCGVYNMTFADGFTVTTPSATTGPLTLHVTSGNAPPPPPSPWTESIDGGGDAGDLPVNAQAITGSGPLGAIIGTFDTDDTDMYRFSVCDYTTFNATTVNGTTVDTQLFIFNADGMGVAVNDDSAATLQSTLTNAFVTSNGVYLLAITRYNRDPVDDSGALLWINTPFASERAPDGPGAANVVSSWTGTTTGNATYTIRLTGACRGSGGPVCIADVDDGSGTGVRDGAVTIDDLLYYLVIYDQGVAGADVDNGTFTGTRDGAVTIDDLLYYLQRYDAGC